MATPWNADSLYPTPALDQAGYFAQNANAGFGDYLNYAQGKTPGGEFQTPNASSLPPGFMQSEYGPAWQSVLAQFNDPNYNRNEDPNNLAAWLKNAPLQFYAGRSLADFTGPTSEANLIGGGRFGLSPATVGQLALGGFGGAAMGAGVGGTAGGGVAGSGGGPATGGLLDAGSASAGTGAGVGAGAGAVAGGAAPTLGQAGGLLSGGAAVVNTLNGGGGTPAQGGGNTGGALGALLGGGLGALQGGNRPAGTTTTTTNQTLAPGGLQQLQNTISGQYLDPASNPYLNQTYDAAARQITPRVNSLFEASGRYGSGAHQGVLGQSLADLGTSIYGGNYNAERARQLAAAGTSIGNTVQNPYFTNPLGGALSGALAGGVLGGGTNFLSGANGGILNGLGGLFNNSGGNTGGTSDQTNNWNPSMPLPDYYGASPANVAYNPASYADPNYYGFKTGGTSPTPTSIDQYIRTPM